METDRLIDQKQENTECNKFLELLNGVAKMQLYFIINV